MRPGRGPSVWRDLGIAVVLLAMSVFVVIEAIRAWRTPVKEVPEQSASVAGR